jgi:alpha-tubulin suppressor-like RCC1 family protein
MRTRSAIFAAVLAVAVAGCNDRQVPTSPQSEPYLTPSFAISDGAHKGGNPNFFFLPPLQPSPRNSPNFDRGKFNPNLAPVVKICDGRELTAQGECVKPLMKNGQAVVFRGVRGWDGLPDWLDPEQYHVLWQTRNYGLRTGNPYRILVKVGNTLLGFLDIVPTSTLLGALRITVGGQDVGWLQNSIVPIRFRIEQGALCAAGGNQSECTESTVIGAAPGSPGDTTKVIVLPSQDAALEIPAGAVKPGDTVTILLEKQAPPDTVNGTPVCLPTGLKQSKGCYHASSTPDLYKFVSPVAVEVCVDVAGFSESDTARIRLYKFNQTERLQALPWIEPTHINCEGFSAMANPAVARPSSFATAALRRVGRWAARLLGPPPLLASMLPPVPKGIGGGGGSLSDFGGAVPAAAILSVTPAESTLVINGDSVLITARLTNYTSDTLYRVDLRAWIEQPGASRYAFSQDTLVACGWGPGEMAPGVCLTDVSRGLFASNTSAGSGTLMPGSATARFELTHGDTVMSTFSVPVILSNVAIEYAYPDLDRLVIGGDSVGSVASLANHGETTLYDIEFHAWIEQPGASREGHSSLVLHCGPVEGVLPPGTCDDRRGLFASNTSAGFGTLAPGSATIRFELTHRDTVLATSKFPVALAASVPRPAKLAVTVEPTMTWVGNAINPAVRVAIEDALGNIVTSATNTVTVDLTGYSGGVGSDSSATAVNGVATFSNLRVSVPGTYTLAAYMVGATITDTIRSTSEAFDVNSFTVLSAGHFHTCGLTTNGEVYCWGMNTWGQLGDGSTTNSSTPVKVSGGLSFESISAQYGHTCGLTTGSVAYCWGRNFEGELGTGDTLNRSAPAPVSGSFKFTELHAGEFNTCGLVGPGTAYCWGYNVYGQNGDGTTAKRTAPDLPVSGGHLFAAVSAGQMGHTCGLLTLSNHAWCWGYNGYGQLGDATTDNTTTPVEVSGGLVFNSVSAGYDHTCGRENSGAGYCWGNNVKGQLGNGSTTNDSIPVKVAFTPGFYEVGAGWYHSCGNTVNGEVYCWGDNTNGQLGNGSTTGSPTPVLVSGGHRLSELTVGVFHTCGLTSAGVAYCWGHNAYGQLGNGSVTDSSVPVLVGSKP